MIFLNETLVILKLTYSFCCLSESTGKNLNIQTTDIINEIYYFLCQYNYFYFIVKALNEMKNIYYKNTL